MSLFSFSRYLVLSITMIAVVGCNVSSGHLRPPEPCSQDWYERVEIELRTRDEHGHGPDLGSQEWRSVVEFKLGLRDHASLPERTSDKWCQYIDHIIFKHTIN